MQVEEIFDYKIVKTHCNNTEFYTNKELKKSYTRIFELPEIRDRYRGAVWDSHDGEGESTEGNDFLAPDILPGSDNLMRWIKEQCIKAVNDIWNIPAKDIIITRSWMNRMYKGSRGKCHKHSPTEYVPVDYSMGIPVLVAVFYVANTINGSSLVIVKDGVHGLLPEEFPEENKHSLLTMPGDLIIHEPEVYHAVSLHNAEEPRICFAFHMSAVV